MKYNCSCVAAGSCGTKDFGWCLDILKSRPTRDFDPVGRGEMVVRELDDLCLAHEALQTYNCFRRMGECPANLGNVMENLDFFSDGGKTDSDCALFVSNVCDTLCVGNSVNGERNQSPGLFVELIIVGGVCEYLFPVGISYDESFLV